MAVIQGVHAIMRIETLSIRTVTVIIFVMIGMCGQHPVPVRRQLFQTGRARRPDQQPVPGHRSGLPGNAQVSKGPYLRSRHAPGPQRRNDPGHPQRRPAREAAIIWCSLLDDPFINGFVGFANINLEKIRVYDLNLKSVAESAKGITGLDRKLDGHLAQSLAAALGCRAPEGRRCALDLAQGPAVFHARPYWRAAPDRLSGNHHQPGIQSPGYRRHHPDAHQHFLAGGQTHHRRRTP